MGGNRRDIQKAFSSSAAQCAFNWRAVRIQQARSAHSTGAQRAFNRRAALSTGAQRFQQRACELSTRPQAVSTFSPIYPLK